MKFMGTLTAILNMLINRVTLLALEDINDANVSQMWGILLLLFVMGLSPILMIMAKNAISSMESIDAMALIPSMGFHPNHNPINDIPLMEFIDDNDERMESHR